MKDKHNIVPYQDELHQAGVIDIWKQTFHYGTAHNEPKLAIAKKVERQDGLFFVALSTGDQVVGTVMCGHDGHRGWIYSLAVLPELQRSGLGSELMLHAERTLKLLGCIKINLQITEGNEGVQSFYETLGYSAEVRVSMGELIKSNIPQ